VNLAPVGYKQVSPYVPIVGGIYQVEVKAPNGAVVAEAHDWSAVAGTVISIVVVEATSGPTLEILSDAAGTSAAPVGAMQTGFGGTAPRTNLARVAMVPVAIALLLLLALAGFLWVRSSRGTVLPESH
jgi:hypothetical protein